MQCARCSKPLPASGRYCLFCGLPINPAEGDGASSATTMAEPALAAPSLAVGEQAPATPAPSAGQAVGEQAPAATGQAEAGFVFQEFGAPASPSRPAAAPMPAPFPLPPAGAPGYPAGVVPRPVAPAGAPGTPFTYASMPMPLPTPPAQVKKRRGRSTGWIILYVFIGLAVLVSGAVFGAVRIGAALGGSLQGSARADSNTRAAAMQLYQQIISQPPTSQNLFADSTIKNWNTADFSTYGSDVSNGGIHVYAQDTNTFDYCPYDADGLVNTALQVQMQITAGDAGGLVFRIAPSADQTTYVYYFFEVTRQGLYRVYLHSNGAGQKLTRLTIGSTATMDSHLGATNTLMVISKGKTFDIFINQQFVLQFQDATLATGSVGVAAGDLGTSTDVYYTNAEFWNLGTA